ncbi:MAG: phosphoribosyltransferase [Nanoarchaeota archaeon]
MNQIPSDPPLPTVAVHKINRFNYIGERQFFLVHSLDGLIEPLSPVTLQAAMGSLLEKISWEPQDYILGLDSGGIVPALAVSFLSGLPLRIACKVNLEIADKSYFIEPGSPNPKIFMYNLPEQGKAIIVDDEIRTGRTVENCILALEQQKKGINSVIVPVESTRFDARQKIRERGYELISYVQHDF